MSLTSSAVSTIITYWVVCLITLAAFQGNHPKKGWTGKLVPMGFFWLLWAQTLAVTLAISWGVNKKLSYIWARGLHVGIGIIGGVLLGVCIVVDWRTTANLKKTVHQLGQDVQSNLSERLRRLHGGAGEYKVAYNELKARNDDDTFPGGKYLGILFLFSVYIAFQGAMWMRLNNIINSFDKKCDQAEEKCKTANRQCYNIKEIESDKDKVTYMRETCNQLAKNP